MSTNGPEYSKACPGKRLPLKGECDRDIASRGVGIGADLMDESKEFLADSCIYSRERHAARLRVQTHPARSAQCPLER